MSDIPIGVPPPQTPPNGPSPGGPGIPGCSFPTADRYGEGARRWSLDLCQQARFTIGVRRPSDYPSVENEAFVEGFSEPVSEHPIRARVEPDQPACRTHYGQMVIGRDGFARAWMAAQPSTWANDTDGGQSMRRNSPMYPFVKEEGTPGTTPTGFVYFGVAFRSEFWSEALLNSEKQYCGQQQQ